MPIKLGKYTHFKGNEYEVTGIATHSETLEAMVIYRALYGDGGVWVCPAVMWDESVEHNGRKVKRFTREDDRVEALPAKPLAGVHNHSQPGEKVALFLSLFAGRDDVFAKRWENAPKGSAGYIPVCYNEWTPACPKTGGGKMKCGDCPNHNFVTFDAAAVEKHLKGQWTAGVYPMFSDETCRFLAFDFDGKEYSPDVLRRDVSAIREVFNEKQINMAVERSRSGKGIHFWIFFSENIPASTARKLGSGMITYTMNKRHELTFKTYDRLIPAQDTLPKGGFGNLIALPLQRAPRAQGNSVFINENFDAYSDQWSYLYNIKKYTLDEVERFIRELSPIGELGLLRKDEDDEKPWERRKPTSRITRLDFPETVNIVRSNMLYIKKDGVSSLALNTLKRLAAFRNPEFYKAQAMRLPTYEKARIISCSEETEQYLCLPRGLEEEVSQILNDCDIEVRWNDAVNTGRRIDVAFNGSLRSEQQQAANSILAYDNGVLAATTAFGKTVIGAYLIAERKVNTLILVHRTNLLSQWVKQVSEFLTINEEPIAEFTPKGRKRKKNIIGQIGGGKDNLSGVIDVAVMQSLISGDKVKALVRNYGMLIVDECHHVSAFSFEKILKNANAKYVYGLTATPTRQDGHHPIIYMQCGKIRYRVDAKSQAEARPFEHYIIPRFTRFQKPVHQDEAKWQISDMYRDIQNSEIRNSLIVRDVISAVEQGRNPLILTERTDHVKDLTARLKPHIKNVIPMTGGAGRKKSRERLQAVLDIPADEPFVLIATGKYLGEGFDLPRLDTLFLTMPVSWKGTVQQYAGRLHRLLDSKKEVQIYDYVDIRVPMLERMYQKRLKGYSAIGYKAKGTPQPTLDTHSIFDNNDFFSAYSMDISAARDEVLIVSPFLSKRRVLSALTYMAATNARITVVAKPSDNYNEKDRTKIDECIEILKQHNITVKTKDRIHQKFAVVDQRIVWYGSINLLSYGTSEESIMRIESLDIARELSGIL
ncbi:MAG: DUF1653 domain-containing protein [Firmicutes bacterium]|nr:DUF1653 domain-containing protein [Bacillota bacterium]